MIIFHDQVLYSERLFLKQNVLSDGRVVSIAKKKYSFAGHFCKDS